MRANATLFISLIIAFRPPARYALLSLPDNLGALPLPKALLSLVVSTLNREHSVVYTQGEKLLSLVVQSDIDKDFGSLLASLLTIFIGVRIVGSDYIR